VNQNSTNTLINVTQGTALVTGGSYVFVLDNEAPNPNPTGAASQILAYTIGSGGALQAATNGVIPMTRTSPTLRGWRWSRRVNGSTWLTREQHHRYGDGRERSGGLRDEQSVSTH